jgi:hypothetical protein
MNKGTRHAARERERPSEHAQSSLPFAKPVVQASGRIASTINGALRAAGLLR